MTKKRPERPARSERRAAERKARELVRDREKLARLVAGGAREHPIVVESAAVVEVRAAATPCPQCAGELRVVEHRADAGLRVVAVRCVQCHVARELWFKLAPNEAN